MKGVLKCLPILGLGVLCFVLHPYAAADDSGLRTNNGVLIADGGADESASVGLRLAQADLNIQRPERINAVIYPHRSATVGTEVRGCIDFISCKEGESIKEGDVIAEISKARYTAIVGEFKGNYDAVVRTLERAREDLKVQKELYEKRATTYDELLKAQSQVSVLEARKEEAEYKMKQAELNLKSCIIKAPFTGMISVLYHEPFEMADNLEKIFGLIDTSKVYARANWPESRLADLAIGKKCSFHYEGTVFEGTIEKIAGLIDPASKSKRVHILIDNPGGKLQVGMSGSVSLGSPGKVSSLSHSE